MPKADYNNISEITDDLLEFFRNLDWYKIDDDTVVLVGNQFKLSELPKTVQEFVKSYFRYIDTID